MDSEINNLDRCPNSDDGEHCGWEFPNKDIICLDCGKVL